MGHKLLKEHYQIEHYIQVTDAGICIGSGYIHDIIVISPDGTLLKGYRESRGNEDLLRYMEAFRSDPAKLREVVLAPDTFTADIPVYTFKGGDIIETRCEQPGWPNVTHEGHMMYNNSYSTDKQKVVEWAKRYADCDIRGFTKQLEQLEKDLIASRGRLFREKAALAKLERDYPTAVMSATGNETNPLNV